MTTKTYFYKDEFGNTKKYLYCVSCLSGPFKEEDSNIFLFSNNKSVYCPSCLKIYFPNGVNHLPLKRSEPEIEIKESENIEIIELDKTLEQVDLPDLNSMTAKQIISEVLVRTGQQITLSIKNKQSILKKAKLLFSKIT